MAHTLLNCTNQVQGVDTHLPPPWSETLLDNVSLWSDDSWAWLSVLASTPITRFPPEAAFISASKSTAPHTQGCQSDCNSCIT
jgi:hypothetical protein